MDRYDLYVCGGAVDPRRKLCGDGMSGVEGVTFHLSDPSLGGTQRATAVRGANSTIVVTIGQRDSPPRVPAPQEIQLEYEDWEKVLTAVRAVHELEMST